MNKKIITLTLFIIAFLVSSNLITAITNQTKSNETQKEIELQNFTYEEILKTDKIILKEGKNKITTSPDFSPIYVKDFIKLNPDIEVISYNFENESTGYINILNGIGQNFIIYPEKEYEIVSKKEVILIQWKKI